MALILLFYILLGAVMDELAMILLTLPIFFPIVQALDFGMPADDVAIWFGILVLMSAEIGLITPPVGLNLFVINAMSRDVSIAETYRGALPFVVSDIIRIACSRAVAASRESPGMLDCNLRISLVHRSASLFFPKSLRRKGLGRAGRPQPPQLL